MTTSSPSLCPCGSKPVRIERHGDGWLVEGDIFAGWTLTWSGRELLTLRGSVYGTLQMDRRHEGPPMLQRTRR